MIKNWMVVKLEVRPVVTYFSGTVEEVFSLALPFYNSITHEVGSIGHYDWLRSNVDRVCGIHFSPFADFSEISKLRSHFSIISGLDYVDYDSDSSSLTLTLEQGCSVNNSISSDQDLGDCAILFNVDNGYSAFFELDFALEKVHLPTGVVIVRNLKECRFIEEEQG